MCRKPCSKNLAWNFSLQIEEKGDLVVTKHHKVNSKVVGCGPVEVVEHMNAAEKQDFSHPSSAIECGSGEENYFEQSKSAKPCTNADYPGRNGNNRAVLSLQESRFDKVFGIHKPDGLQELLQFSREFELEEALQGVSQRQSHTHTEGLKKGKELAELKDVSSLNGKEGSDKSNERTEVLYQGESKPTNFALENTGNCKAGMEVSCLEGSWATRIAPEKEVASCSLSDETSDLEGCERTPPSKLDCDQAHKSKHGCKNSSITVGPSRSQFTIPRPFSFATDKRALGRQGSKDVEVSPNALESNGTVRNTCLRTPEISKRHSSRLLVVDKALCSGCAKNYEGSIKKLSIDGTSEHCDEDAMSISSIKSCFPFPIAKASRFTNAASFKFHSDVRAERRKEYYAKLQERLSAKEKETNELQAKAQKDREEEIRLFRKSLTFKAHPVPNFYQEGPPQSKELPKTPTTRAKSPNFSRRESNFRGSTRFCNNLKCEADHRISLSPRKLGNGSNMELHDHGNCYMKPVEKKISGKLSERNSDGNMHDTLREIRDAEISLTNNDWPDIHAKVWDPLIVSSELMKNDEEGKLHLEQIGSLSSSNKAVHNAQPLVFEKKDLQSKEGDLSNKEQQYRALTPNYRKHETNRNGLEAASEQTLNVKRNMDVGPR